MASDKEIERIKDSLKDEDRRKQEVQNIIKGYSNIIADFSSAPNQQSIQQVSTHLFELYNSDYMKNFKIIIFSIDKKLFDKMETEFNELIQKIIQSNK